MRRAIGWLLAVGLLAGCGGGSQARDAGAGGSALVDSGQQPPWVTSLVPSQDGVLLATNKGLYRVAGGQAAPMWPVIVSAGRREPIGGSMSLAHHASGALLGSGHIGRDQAATLGLARSQDGGRTWRPVGLLGSADLHALTTAHGRIYAWEALSKVVMVSSDGEAWTRTATPPGTLDALAVDPDDRRRLVAAVDGDLFRSADEGRRWRPLLTGSAVGLAWPQRGLLVRADADGRLWRSADGGNGWRQAGQVSGTPGRLHAVDARRWLVALEDATVLQTRDGGRSFRALLRP